MSSYPRRRQTACFLALLVVGLDPFLRAEDSALKQVRKDMMKDLEAVTVYARPSEPRSTPENIEEGEKLLADPDFMVRSTFLASLMAMSFNKEHPYPSQDQKLSLSPEGRSQAKERAALEESFNWAFAQRVDRLWPLKRGTARIATIYALHVLIDNTSQGFSIARLPYTSKALVDMRDRLLGELAQHLDELSQDTQLSLVCSYGKSLSRPGLLPKLVQLYEDPTVDKPWGSKDLHTHLLGLIHDIDPKEARKLILQDLNRGKARFDTSALQWLPPDQAPPMDNIILQFLAGLDWKMSMTLLNRYGSPMLVPHIRDLYLPKVGRYACELEQGYLAYLVKNDRSEETNAALDKSLSSRVTGCYKNLLREVVKYHGFTPSLFNHLDAQLHDPNLDIAGSAADAMSRYGGQEAREALWKRLEEFHREYGAKPDALASATPNPMDNSLQRFESALIGALSHSPNWMLNQEALERLSDLSVSSYQKPVVQSMIKNIARGVIPIAVSPGVSEHWKSLDPRGMLWSSLGSRSDIDSWRLANSYYFSREEMLQRTFQYPAGTTFSFQFQGKISAEEEQATFDSLQKDLAAKGMKLVPGAKWEDSSNFMGAE